MHDVLVCGSSVCSENVGRGKDYGRSKYKFDLINAMYLEDALYP